MPKTMSLKQLAANRRNAEKSTGPKTPAGRAIAKMNAVKHGILSKEVVVRGRYIQESTREFTALHQRFVAALGPVGPVEEMLVDQIVTTHWRLRRALKAESGEVALSVDGGRWQRYRGMHPALQWLQWEALGDPIRNMQDSALGSRFLEKWLGDVREAVEQDGELTEAAIQALGKGFGGKPNVLTRELQELRVSLLQNAEGLDGAALRERNQQRALAFLNKKLRRLTWWKSECEAREKSAEEAHEAAAVLPALPVLEKILRYETKLERQMYRAMNQLERLQRMRQGEAIPAPLTMEVTERG